MTACYLLESQSHCMEEVPTDYNANNDNEVACVVNETLHLVHRRCRWLSY